MSFFSLLNLKHPAFVTLHLHGPDRTTVPRACSTGLPLLQRLQTGPQSHVLQVCPCFRESRQDHSPQGMFYRSDPFRESRQDHSPMSYRSAPASENPDRTTVPRACSTGLTPSENPDRTTVPCPTGLPPFRESRQDHSPQSMFYRSAPASEKQKRSSGPLKPHGKNSWGNMRTLLKTKTFTQTITLTIWGPSWRPEPSPKPSHWPFEDPLEDQNLHPNHHTDHLRTLPKTRTFTQTITLTIWGPSQRPEPSPKPSDWPSEAEPSSNAELVGALRPVNL